MRKKIFLIFILAFMLNFIWEHLHAGLYFLPTKKPITELMLLRSTVIDAVFITFMGFIFMTTSFLRGRVWLVIIFGILLAIVIELRALGSLRWAYTEAMPIVPILNTGLTPTVQLGLLAFLIFELVGLGKQPE